MMAFILGSGGGLFLIVVGGMALLRQRIVQQQGATEVKLPFGISLKTNYPALVFPLLGVSLFYAALPVPAPQPASIVISGKVLAEGGVVRDALLGVAAAMQPVSQLTQPQWALWKGPPRGTAGPPAGGRWGGRGRLGGAKKCLNFLSAEGTIIMDSVTKRETLAHPCPACGYYMFSELDNQAEICPICSWQNDLIDLEAMYRPWGPNHVSLEEAQKNFARIGAIEQRFVGHVRQPTKGDIRDPKWRPLDRSKDKPRKIDDPYGKKPEELYYWYWN